MVDALPLIAVVDDEESVRTAVSRLMRARGFDAQTFASGEDFLRSLEHRVPACLILDLRMPQFNGFDVLGRINRRAVRLPVIVITGDDSPRSRLRALAHGADAYLRKPVDEAMLLGAIRTSIRSASAR